MKVKATQELHIRAHEPWRRTTNKKGIIFPGFEIEVVETIETNTEVIDGNGKWYKDKNGDFYWSGGFYEKSSEENLPVAPDHEPFTDTPTDSPDSANDDDVNNLFHFKTSSNFPKLPDENTFKNALNNWWIDDFKIRQIWEEYGTMGEGCNILVLDTGYALHNDLANNELMTGWNFKDKNNNFDDENSWHGSKVTSVINSYHPNLLGVAPRASVFMAKGSSGGPIYFMDALEKATENKDIDIIVMSYGYSDNKVFRKRHGDRFKNAIESNSDKLIVVSSGKKDEKSKRLYPALYRDTISVGAINEAKKNENFNNTLANIEVFAPGEDIKLLNAQDNNTFITDSGTSYAAPYVAGVLALLISYVKVNHSERLDQIDFRDLIRSKDDNDTLGIINPTKSFEELISKLS